MDGRPWLESEAVDGLWSSVANHEELRAVSTSLGGMDPLDDQEDAVAKMGKIPEPIVR